MGQTTAGSSPAISSKKIHTATLLLSITHKRQVKKAPFSGDRDSCQNTKNWIGYFEMWFLAENEKTLRRTYAGLYLDFGPVG